MLAEAVVAGAEKLRRAREERRDISPSGVSVCARKTYMGWTSTQNLPDGRSLLLMNDGHYQEIEILDDLERAGFQIKNRQTTDTPQRDLHISKTEGSEDYLMVGHADCDIFTQDKWHMLDAKAMSMERFTNFSRYGFQAEPDMECQMTLYLGSDEYRQEGITSGFVYAKHKDSCRSYDLPFNLKEGLFNELVDQVRRINEGWVPEPIRSKLCVRCRHKIPCWKVLPIEMEAVKVVSLPEMVTQWKKGKGYKAYGEDLIGEAREAFEEELGNSEVISIEDLKVQRVIQTRTGISYDKFVKKFGAAALADVWEEKKIPQMRINIQT